MLRKIIFTFVCCLIAISSAWCQQGFQISPIEPIQKNDRILILAPHPDDETIGCAGIIQQALKAGADVHVAYLTNGDHNEFAFIVYKKELIWMTSEFIAMGELRKKEAIAAMKLLGLNRLRLVFLGYPDYGTFHIFKDYWQSERPFRDFLTRISSVPYKEDLSYGAPYKAENILDDLEKLLRLYNPTKIFVSHPADVNVDHKTLYLFLEVALADLEWELPRPKIYPYLIHWVGWPMPRHYRPELTLSPPQSFLGSPILWSEDKLTPEGLEKKHQAVLCYRSQTASSAFYLLAFARKNELFGSYPQIKLVIPAKPKEADKLAALKKQFAAIFKLSDKRAGLNEGIPGELGKFNFNVDDNAFLIRIHKTKESSDRRVAASFYLFGYSFDTPFAQMPKLHIITKHKNFRVFDGKKEITPEGMSLDLSRQDLTLKVPLKVLGSPDFILASARAYTGALPEDTIGFCKINLFRGE
ncbi:MAG: PIG-L family deacetylase [Candidatus Omnitrophica bacterium]|jgi:LmbE family N-acetylglucosaminyl deacetylase|nr:PIG-L family deacetylase [Candidatus Omnitrophota bacterium]